MMYIVWSSPSPLDLDGRRGVISAESTPSAVCSRVGQLRFVQLEYIMIEIVLLFTINSLNILDMNLKSSQ